MQVAAFGQRPEVNGHVTYRYFNVPDRSTNLDTWPCYINPNKSEGRTSRRGIHDANGTLKQCLQ